jgi:hypothetical protein
MSCYKKQAEKFFKERKYKESCIAWETYAYFVASKELLEKVNLDGEKRIAKNKGGYKNEKRNVFCGLEKTQMGINEVGN